MITSVLQRLGWSLEHQRQLPGRKAEYYPVSDLQLRPETHRLLNRYPEGVYCHQRLALESYLAGEDLCVATGTASGKSLVFYATGVDCLAADPGARILAIYPLKALAREQETRWKKELEWAGIEARVGRIDGGVKDPQQRERILASSRVVLMTPDIIHAWLLSSLSSRRVQRFLASLRLVIVDEVHVYTGVFGSNAAYVFRRLQHAAHTLAGGDRVQFVAASATVANPEQHLAQLFGRTVRVIGDQADTSPRHERQLYLVRPPTGQSLYTALPHLLRALVDETPYRFLTFVDSRRQTEQLATILARARFNKPEEDLAETDGEESGEPEAERESDAASADRLLERLPVLPYRSGYEETDREAIQSRLSEGTLRGIISTSALELGLDIQGLDMVILVGIPQTTTSLQQRIGRVGRHGPGTIVLIDAGGLADELVFNEPERLFDRPLLPAVLHLENRRIQYIHALCFASRGGEYDTLTGMDVEGEGEIALRVTGSWPPGFLELCQAERAGQVPLDLHNLKADGGDDPWHAFPLRDVGVQYTVEQRTGDLVRLGSLSSAQLMREAYPGAVYYYLTRPYRVVRVSQREKKVLVKRERYYTTDPYGPPVLISPQLTPEGVHRAVRMGELRAVECELYVSERVFGYTERRGGNKLPPVKYPCEYWHLASFGRNYTSTGVILSHPVLSHPGVQVKLLADLLLEAFLLVVPFERSEVNSSTGKHWKSQTGFQEGEPFLAIYDQTYGSLRLTGRLLEPGVLREVVAEAMHVLRSGRVEAPEGILDATVQALQQLAEDCVGEPEPLELFASSPEPAGELEGERVIVPGSVGWIVTDDNQEFEVERVFCHPKEGLRYYGRRRGQMEQPDVQVWFPAANIRPIPGISRMGIYDYETGEVRPLDE